LNAADRSIPASQPPLADTLRLLLPCAHTTLLLQATLLDGDAVRQAWSTWRQLTPDPKAFLAADRIGIKRHLPLLYRNLTNCGVELGRDLEPYFRAARAREELRSTRYRRFLGDALTALQRSRVPFIVGKGVTIGETVHDDPVLRHSHDIDLLVRPADLPAAAAALQSAGFNPSDLRPPRGEPRFDHASGLPVELHTALYRTPFYDGCLSAIWDRARPGQIVGIDVRLISDTDLLVQSPVHASLVWQRQGLSWIVDLLTLLHRRATESVPIDWTAVTRTAIDARIALPLLVMYRYLAAELRAPIPEAVIEELRSAAARTRALQQLAALEGLRADPRQRRLKVIALASGWRSRAAIARAMLLPPPAYLRELHPEGSRLRLALLYAARPTRFIARQLNRLRFRLQRRWSSAQPAPLLPGFDVSCAGRSGT
jgi:hypothetical protein